MTRATKKIAASKRIAKPKEPDSVKLQAAGDRHDFTASTRITIAERSGYKCANPSCLAVTVGPASQDAGSSARVGMAAHINAASPNGPRYLSTQTESERRSAENGLWACEACGKLIDSDISGHTTEELKEWKATAERRAQAEFGLASSAVLFSLRYQDQTTYINLPRFQTMASKKGYQLSGLPAPNTALLSSEVYLGSIVDKLEGVLKEMKLDAIPITNVKTQDQCDAVVGKLISFQGRFRSRNAPRVRDGGAPVYHPSGDPKEDHHIHKEFGKVELVLPLDSFWYASQSAVGLFRSKGYVSVRGIARVHSTNAARIIASPVWMALPGQPLYD